MILFNKKNFFSSIFYRNFLIILKEFSQKLWKTFLKNPEKILSNTANFHANLSSSFRVHRGQIDRQTEIHFYINRYQRIFHQHPQDFIQEFSLEFLKKLSQVLERFSSISGGEKWRRFFFQILDGFIPYILKNFLKQYEKIFKRSWWNFPWSFERLSQKSWNDSIQLRKKSLRNSWIFNSEELNISGKFSSKSWRNFLRNLKQ